MLCSNTLLGKIVMIILRSDHVPYEQEKSLQIDFISICMLLLGVLDKD
jgi:hypothetical protein